MVDYDRNSPAQQRTIGRNAERIRNLIERIGWVGPEFRIMDYGCGPGASTIDVAKTAIAAYRKITSHGPIAICHADQPGNDWNALFKLVAGTSGYLDGASGVRCEAAVGTFYDQMVADGSVALGTCFWASHWLHHSIRLRSPGTVWFADLSGTARKKMETAAQRDWTRFLRLRAAELREGGFLLVSTLGAVPDDSEINGAAVSARGIYRALQAVAQSMADDSLIDCNCLDSFVFGLWFMTENEARRALDSDPVLAEAFEIEDISVRPTSPNPTDFFAPALADPIEYARLYTGYIRAFADSTLHAELFEPSAADPSGTASLAAEFYRRLDAVYRTSEGKYAYELWHLTVVLRRR